MAATSEKLRCAVMVPQNNTTVQSEMPAYFAGHAEMDLIRIPRPKALLTTETLPAYAQSACDLAEGLTTKNYDLIVYACTAASFIQGRAADDALASRLSDIAGCPVVTTASSMARRMNSLGCKTISLVTPYSTAVNKQLTAYINDCGIEVARLGEMNAADTEALGRITAEEVETCARETWDDETDGLFIACTQLPTRSFIRALDGELGKPAWSAIRATAWAAGDRAGFDIDG